MDPALLLNRVSLHLEARDIPVPAHISEPARIFLASAGMAPRSVYPTAAEPEAWRAAAEAWNGRMLPMIEPILSALPVAVETHLVGACDVHVATPEAMAPSAARYAYMDIHGGALVFGAGRFAQLMAVWRAAALGCRVFGVDYRVPPDHRYPAALDDCMGVYRYLLERHAPADIVIGGISAGGNLAAATVLRARDEGLPLPAAAILLTPELDLTESGDSFVTNRDIDVALPQPLPEANLLYADRADLADPYVSPLFGDFERGFPPAFLQSGTRDLFLSNTVRMHRALLRAGRQAELHVWEAMPHAGFGGSSPEDLELHQAVRDYLVRVAGWAV
jgi:acetyl esterase/lipase